MIYKELKKYDLSVINYNKALVYYESTINKERIASVYHNVGSVFCQQKSYSLNHTYVTCIFIIVFSQKIVNLTCKRNLSERQDNGHNVGKHLDLIVYTEVGQAEQQHVEDDAADVEGDQRHQDLAEDGLQVHVLAAQDHD